MHQAKAHRTNLSRYRFVRDVLHSGTNYFTNCHHLAQIALHEIELLGSVDGIDKPSIHYKPSDLVAERPQLPPSRNDSDELQTVLLDAGIPMDLVAQVANVNVKNAEMVSSPQHHHGGSPLSDINKIAPVSNKPDNDNDTAALSEDTQAFQAIENDNCGATSPFDKVLRHYVEQSVREKAVLEEILATRISNRTEDVSLWLSPTIPLEDPANSSEITLYTFGVFFTQCILCGESDIQVTCIQMAERFACFLVKTIGVTDAFEGIVALIVLGAREAKSRHVFQAAIHLAHTVFLGSSSRQPGQARDAIDSSSGRSATALGVVEEVPQSNWSYGLRIILEWTLASSLCWSITNRTGKPSQQFKTDSQTLKSSGQAANGTQSIDRSFLQFIRLLVGQDLTRSSFFDELLDLTPTTSATGSLFATNRLRLIRLALRNEIIRCQISTNVKDRIRTLCNSITTASNTTNTQVKVAYDDTVRIRLASECLDKINESEPSTHVSSYEKQPNMKWLASVHKHLEISSSPNNHHSHYYCHKPLCIEDPSEAAPFATQLQQYFLTQPRPSALYRHTFVLGACTASNDDTEVKELFKKGNIAFQGHVFPRNPPSESFHEEIQRKAAPFVFDISNGNKNPNMPQTSQVTGLQEIVSAFAAFRGTIERRSDRPKQLSKVVPQNQHLHADVKGTIAATANKPSVVSTSNNNNPTATLPSTVGTVSTSAQHVIDSSPAAMISRPNDIKISTQLADSPVVSQTPQVTPPVQNHLESPPAIVAPETLATSQVSNTNQTNPSKSGPDVEVKQKGKRKTNSDTKDPENCVLQ
ncbi:unnamed protein product [Phytophthora lilii]|uniref:Unnamed protein product n=1 Tax=Phytophthora lilii TaxID=2077276 RepID=A0A9W6WQR3_9STRA|nr:unnamed protein product [Phytophthora lilii]